MTTTYADNEQQVLDGLASLPPEGLREAQARLAVLLATNGVDALPEGEDADRAMVYTELAEYVRKKTGAKPAPLNVLLKTKFGPAFRSGADELLRYAAEHLKPQGRNGKAQAVRLLVGLVVRQVMLEKRIPRLAVGPLACHLSRVGELVDDAFPGYVEAGVLDRVLRPRPLH